MDNNTWFQEKQSLLSVNIPDVDGGAATLYVSNGGTRPSTPRVGDFLYDLLTTSFHVYHSDGWKGSLLEDVERLLWHPDGNNAVVSFTGHAIPYWMPAIRHQGKLELGFHTMDALLREFKKSLNPKEFTVRIHSAQSKSDFSLE